MIFTDDEVRARIEAEHKLVGEALSILELRDRNWGSNYNAWHRMDMRARYQWYERMKVQADKGLSTARTLIGEVIAQRLRG